MTLFYLEKRQTVEAPWKECSIATLQDVIEVENLFSKQGQASLMRIKESFTDQIYPQELQT